MVHLLTFNCYGTHLRGDENGSLDRPRKSRGGPIEPAPRLVQFGKQAMTHQAAKLNLQDSHRVLQSIQATCAYRHWTLIAAHVRTTHVHLIVDGMTEIPKAIRDLKAYASRSLNQTGTRPHWARGANVRRLSDPKAIQAAVHYVADRQGTPMALYVSPDF